MLCFESQTFSNIAWAAAILQMGDAPLLDSLSAAANGICNAFGSQDLSNMAWAYASLEWAAGPLLNAIAAAALPTIAVFHSQCLSNLPWSLAKLQVEHEPALEAICLHRGRALRNFTPQSLSTTPWAVAKLMWENMPLLAALPSSGAALQPQFAQPDISTPAWSVSTLLVQDFPACDSIYAAALVRVRQCDSVQISMTLWSSARRWWAYAPLRYALWHEGFSGSCDFTPQALANTAWSVSVLGCDNGDVLSAPVAQFWAVCPTTRSRRSVDGDSGGDGGGVEWADMASVIVAERGGGGAAATGGVAADNCGPIKVELGRELELDFASHFFWPLTLCLLDLSDPRVPHTNAVRALSYQVDKTGAASMGTVHTRLAIAAAARAELPPRTWADAARVAVYKELGGRVGAGRTERCIAYGSGALAWRDDFIALPGAIYHSLPRGPPAPIGESPEDRARALIAHIHRHVLRDNHAERAVLLAVCAAAVRLTGDGKAGGEGGRGGGVLAECMGTTRVYASHVPCVSCAAAVAQFSRCLPLVRLEFEFEDAWRSERRDCPVGCGLVPPEEVDSAHGSDDER
eukprot:NODE_221_length_3365_cov_6.682829.p1 GENE.NODE_221_length_3365_cov_6.682829~~NODE_221_length_3365_cov_6.682829.p1  ORF type:complete len:574 (-),score=95.20 NODE_221_length_3365_cov_6.682829:245-1966(-)